MEGPGVAWREVLERLGASKGELNRAAEMALLLARSLSLGPGDHLALRNALAPRCGLDSRDAEPLVDVALSPAFRAAVTSEEMRIFAERFGENQARRLAETWHGEPTLASFAARGIRDSLTLLDAMAELATGERARLESAVLDAAEALGIDERVALALLDAATVPGTELPHRWTLHGERMVIGRGAGAEVRLPDPEIARNHAVLLRVDGRWRLSDGGSGRPLRSADSIVGTAPMNPGESVRMGPWSLRLDGEALVGNVRRSSEALSVVGLSRSIGALDILDRVSFAVFPGELVALVGPSGAGKTSLVAAITGLSPADDGEVRLGGTDFHALLRADPAAVGFVPQDDLVYAKLSVEEALYYAGRLRHGPEVRDREVSQRVDQVVEELGLGAARQMRIGDAVERGISGGQRKRVSLGQELITEGTRVLFLDEPTSGLDPLSARDVIRQSRLLADEGRIVFVVTHDLGPAMLAQVDRLLVMVPGGSLGFFGTPEEACRYFEVSSADRIFDRLDERSSREWAERFIAHPLYRRRVQSRLSWVQRQDRGPEPQRRRPASLPDQARALTARYARIRGRDPDARRVLVAQPLVLAALIVAVFPVPTARTLFMLCLSCLWFGMSGAVRELIADRAIQTRERALGVGAGVDLAAKALVLGAINALQCSAFTALIFWAMKLGDYGYSLAPLVGVQVLTGFVGVALGLAVSAQFRSSEAAVGTLPLLLIPNICFSGMLVSLRDMGAFARALTWLTPGRYAFDLSVRMGEALAEAGRVPGEWQRRPITGPLYELGFKGAAVGDLGLSPQVLAGALGAFAVVFLLVAWRRARRG